MAQTQIGGFQVEKDVPKVLTDDETLDFVLVNPTSAYVQVFIGDEAVPNGATGGVPVRQDKSFVRDDAENKPYLQGKVTVLSDMKATLSFTADV